MFLSRSERTLVILLALIAMSGPMSLTIMFPALLALACVASRAGSLRRAVQRANP